jgi:DNA-binding phage protein
MLIHVRQDAIAAVAELQCLMAKNDQPGLHQWVARQVGVSPQQLYRWLSGSSTPRQRHVYRIRDLIAKANRGEYR